MSDPKPWETRHHPPPKRKARGIGWEGWVVGKLSMRVPFPSPCWGQELITIPAVLLTFASHAILNTAYLTYLRNIVLAAKYIHAYTHT